MEFHSIRQLRIRIGKNIFVLAAAAPIDTKAFTSGFQGCPSPKLVHQRWISRRRKIERDFVDHVLRIPRCDSMAFAQQQLEHTGPFGHRVIRPGTKSGRSAQFGSSVGPCSIAAHPAKSSSRALTTAPDRASKRLESPAQRFSLLRVSGLFTQPAMGALGLFKTSHFEEAQIRQLSSDGSPFLTGAAPCRICSKWPSYTLSTLCTARVCPSVRSRPYRSSLSRFLFCAFAPLRDPTLPPSLRARANNVLDDQIRL
jgi:hypothetical protein